MSLNFISQLLRLSVVSFFLAKLWITASFPLMLLLRCGNVLLPHITEPDVSLSQWHCFVGKKLHLHLDMTNRGKRLLLIVRTRWVVKVNYLVLGWLWSAFTCAVVAAAVLSTTAAAVVVVVVVVVTEDAAAQLLLLLLQRSSRPGAGTESTEQMLDRDEISLWLESDRLSALPAGRRATPGERRGGGV